MPQTVWTLQEAARDLNVSARKLNRWLELAEIEPVIDAGDKRKRVLSGEQMTSLKELYGAAGPTSADDLQEQVESLAQEVRGLRASLASLTTWVTSLSENITTLAQRHVELEGVVEKLADTRGTVVPAGNGMFIAGGGAAIARVAGITSGRPEHGADFYSSIERTGGSAVSAAHADEPPKRSVAATDGGGRKHKRGAKAGPISKE